jgi:hypothetical protein
MDIAHVWVSAHYDIAIYYDYDPHVPGARVLRSNAKRYEPVSVFKLLDMKASCRESTICRRFVGVKCCIIVSIESSVIYGTRHF